MFEACSDNNDNIVVPMVLLSKYAVLPSYAHEHDAGMDIYATEDVLLLPGETKLVPTGLAAAIPQGYEAQIRPRSGISLKTMLRIPNSPGTIDAGYRDQICIIMHNASFLHSDLSDQEYLTLEEKGNRHGTYLIRRGDKIAQMVFAQISHVNPSAVLTLDGIGVDRKGGFGSTGI
jgi:dUTP pyrophosphatase